MDNKIIKTQNLKKNIKIFKNPKHNLEIHKNV